MTTNMKLNDDSVEVTRFFPHARDVVFDAWTDPQQLAHWWGCKQTKSVTATSDPKPGGKVQYIMHMTHGDVTCAGEYIEFDRPERLVTRCTMGSGTDFEFESTTTVEFAEAPGGTEVKLTQVGLPPVPDCDKIVGGGLSDSLDKLTAHLAA